MSEQIGIGLGSVVLFFNSLLVLIQQESPVLPVEATIAVRRLEEEFCLRFVRCAHNDPNSFRFRASFRVLPSQ